MRVLRVYLKPAGEQWLDMPLSPGFETPNVMAALKSVGWVIDPNWLAPVDMIAWAVIMELGEPASRPQPTVVPFSPPYKFGTEPPKPPEGAA